MLQIKLAATLYIITDKLDYLNSKLVLFRMESSEDHRSMQVNRICAGLCKHIHQWKRTITRFLWDQHSRRSSFDNSDSLKGRGMLVAAIMDVVTSNCDGLEKVCFKPVLPGNAETRDIADVIEVIEEGGMHFDEPQRDEDDDDGGRGMRGIGIKILEGTTVLGLSRTSRLMKLGDTDDVGVESDRPTPKTLALLNKHDSSSSQALSSAIVPGLWDDLHCQHVAVPFAAWQWHQELTDLVLKNWIKMGMLS